ncbi:VENN motif pre-toxin domain-containing protein [Proteus terrae]|uniref:VENN motif pre-toxin domain-containing protein n=1 Tax=Proteus terrae TaxID=1574161 RepID=UPI002871C42F|nr:VENN motif pre-toxin domain-containing protein [Proteus terrae]MDR9740683.1 VENN motif pre-toxin domain-containing protein [Proteus terrae]
MGNNIVTAIANGSAPYLANEVKNQIQGNSVESDIQRTIAHGLLNAGLALAKGENAVVQASGAMTGETVGILSHSVYGKTPEELTETEKQNISAWATLTSGIVGGLISDNSTGVANAAQAGKVVVENNYLNNSDHRQKTSLELKERQGNITEVEQLKLAELRIKDINTTQAVLDACVGGTSPECTAARKDAFKAIDTYVNLTYQNPKTAQAGYQEIERLLNSTSSEAQQAFNLLESYTEAFKNFGYPDNEARVRAGMYVGSIYAFGGVSAVVNSGILVKQFGKDIAKPRVKLELIPPKGSNNSAELGAGSKWAVDKNGVYSPKKIESITKVEKGDTKYNADLLPYKDIVGKVDPNTNYIDILSPEAKLHILYGESPTQGGHLFPGNPGKTTFPSNWPAEKVIHEIGDIATSPTTQWYAQSGTGGLYTKAGRPARWVAWETRDGVRMRVIYEPANGKVVTAFPDKTSQPGSLKPIK